MTPAEYAAKSREAQGLPPTITDPVVIAKVATIIRLTTRPKNAK